MEAKVREREKFEEAILLVLEMKERDHKPRNSGSLWKPEKARKPMHS